MTTLAFASLLRARLQRYYIAEVDLARALCVAPGLVGRWISGEATPAAEDRPQLALLLRLTLPELEAVLGDTPTVASTPRPPIEVMERAAREYWPELHQLPPVFREAVLLAELRGGSDWSGLAG